jgi:hypothetical protein
VPWRHGSASKTQNEQLGLNLDGFFMDDAKGDGLRLTNV